MKCGSLVFDEMTREQASQILGISPSASADTVRSAYKELVQVWHPDRFATGPESLKQRAHNQIVLLNEAYQCLNLRTTGISEESAQGKSSSPGQSGRNSRSEDPKKNSYDADFLRLRARAEQGDANAQFDLGNAYAKGNGVPKDAVKAVFWFRKAAEHGIPEAQFNMGVAYAHGNGVTRDAAQAVSFFRKAAEQGFEHAQYNLGVIYIEGEGVSKDATPKRYPTCQTITEHHATPALVLSVFRFS